MKINIYLVGAFSIMLLMACGGHHHNHDHEEHEAHDHDVAHQHETHHHTETKQSAHQDAPVHEGHAGEIIIAPEQAQAANIVAEKIEPRPFRGVIPVSGEIVSAQGEEQTVVANVAGVVTFNRLMTEGASVKKGSDLLTLSSEKMADGSPAERARIAYEATKQEYERAARLVEDKIVSEKEFIRIKEAFENARLTYEAMNAGQSGQSGVSVMAPMAGYLKNCLVREGDYVNVGQPLLTISQVNRLYLRADVPEKHYAHLEQIQSANFRTSYDDKVYTLDEVGGRLLSYGRTTGEQSFYLSMTFEMENKPGFVPGSYAEIWLLSEEQPDVLYVPYSALTEEQGVYAVYVKLDEACYERREVTLGADNGREVQLLSGVHAGEQVVMQGAYHVRLASVSKSIPGHSHNH